ncbi:MULTISPECIES: CYTH and CHAD domain-containing protein [Bradyrhizobium]|uniref:CYTH and CHAD domain-containing protein n=1 Tax=Bradyrhizobium TaxID=374 RepID=UPI00155F47B4|nr:MULTISPECIES: CYTH and CHAD domain-containing protein [Bradyrhizobium]MDD1516341.1 inorganic triphosphatase [Bradyrhizobium sp. WBAH30]MDD1546942.1 inorganic triphosphatase [Bradyrhizobium sp. WBAH41]MDD1554245.1 inorganic triphosphatase [Bradyrhizobium sp. WBAH23]MDD1562196.1 inorganic triphosphatase [Bradyrhizobium sp. WBAH33]MDD1591731.1 inorganic triphosphatase [Bradyrhizobium sp. WBAH42]
MLKSDAAPARKTPSAPETSPALGNTKRTQLRTGFLGQREEVSVEPATAEERTPIEQTPSQDVTPAPNPTQPAHPAGEIELKLLVDADRMADFRAAPVIAANARNKGARKRLKSVYYDTPERALRRAGLSLRVRQSGTRFVQTVKTEVADDPLRRGEWEASVPSLAPDFALAMPFIPDKLRGHLDAQPLEAVFSADVHRHTRIVDLPSGTVEVAFDQGELSAGGRSMPVSEIELELKSGSPSAIYEIALRLAEHGTVKPSIRSKSARGFDLAGDLPPSARRPRKLRLDPSVTLDEAFATILRACFLHLLQSLPAAEDGRNPEGVHQLRVSLRRLRSALDLMRSVGALSHVDALRSEATWLAQGLSAARDWDVFQLATLPAIAKACPSVAGFDALGQVAAQRQAQAYRRARNALDDRRCAVFLIGLGGWIETRGWRNGVAPEDLGRLAEPAVNFAQRVLSEQYAKVLKRGRRFKSLTIDELHRLRLATKRLRYLSEFLLPLYEDRKSARKFARRLAGLQEELGVFNDMAVTASLLDGLGSEDRDSAIAAAAIAGWQARASIGVQQGLQDSWRDFTAARVPWSRQGQQS